jgi:hypothetical protein
MPLEPQHHREGREIPVPKPQVLGTHIWQQSNRARRDLRKGRERQYNQSRQNTSHVIPNLIT